MTQHERTIYLEDIPLEEVFVRVERALRQAGRWEPLAGEDVPLAEALGRITAEPIWAKLSAPHYHAAAMDGYAVRATDTHLASETRPVRLKVGESAYPINTGNPLPPETNAVIMIEDVQEIPPDSIEIRAAVAPWQYVRMMGEDMVATELVLPTNHKIRPVDLGAIAGCGHYMVKVRRQPQVVIIPTGSELVPATQVPNAGQIIEYNSLILRGQIIEAGGTASVTDIVPDHPADLKRALQQAVAIQPDLILVLSGSSAGSEDYTAAVLHELGELLVHGIAVRPGHPVIIGMVGGIMVIGVPGYPVSAALTGEILIQPQLACWLGIKPPSNLQPRLQAVMTRKVVSHMGDDDFVRVTLAQVEDRLLAIPLHRGAGVITSLVRADGLAHIPRFSEGVEVGQSVEVRLYLPLDVIQKTLLMMGSHDPMLDLLGGFLSQRHPDYRLNSAHVGSLGGLVALKRKEAHLAGSHLLDEITGEYNLSFVHKYLPGEPVQIITFAHREQGLLIPKGNPLGVQSLDDLPRLRYVNRQRGAGTRLLLDYELKQRGISPESIEGYEREEYTHLAVAAAVASGSADCGMGVRSAAIALGLDFVSIGWERYDFIIPAAYLNLPAIQYLLDLLHDAEFRGAMGQQAGYDLGEMGKIQG
jgi:putative molybdopterin biosynthesis protein